MFSFIIFQLGLFNFNVSQAFLSISISPIVLKPAFSIPRANPPAPANNSIAFNCTSEFAFFLLIFKN